MDDEALITRIGPMLRRRRDRAGLTQTQLAALANTSQATVARVERGDRTPSIGLVARLFEALRCQVRLTLEPLHREVDEAIAVLAAVPLGQRVAEAGLAGLAEQLAPIRHVFTGATAALLQGVPVPAVEVEIALAWRDADTFVRWLEGRFGSRWHEGYQQFGYLPLDPREPGAHRWRIAGGTVIRARLADELPASLEVTVGGRGYRVVPLIDAETDLPEAARLLRRYRETRPSADLS